MYTFGLKQLISQPTRITKSSETIIDHFCTNRVDLISEVKVSDYSVSDYFPTACTYRLNNVKAKEKQHNSVYHRCFKSIDIEFNNDLQCQDLNGVKQCITPNESLKQLYHVINTYLFKHAPLKEKCIKRSYQSAWLIKN